MLRDNFCIIGDGIYWTRLVREAGWAEHYDDRFFAGYFGFRQQLFPSLPNAYNLFATAPPKLYIDLIIILTATMLLPFIVFWFWKRKCSADSNWRPLFAISSVSLVGLFMMSKASFPVWYLLTPLQRIQFPWRWLAVVSVLAPISFALSITRLKEWLPEHRSRIAVFVFAFIVIIVSFDIRQTFARPSRVDRPEFHNMADMAFRSAQKHSQHWRPKWAKQAALDVSDRVMAPGRYVEVTGWDRYHRAFNVGAGEPGQIRVSTFYYPNWKASVNGQSVQVGMDENGAI